MMAVESMGLPPSEQTIRAMEWRGRSEGAKRNMSNEEKLVSEPTSGHLCDADAIHHHPR